MWKLFPKTTLLLFLFAFHIKQGTCQDGGDDGNDGSGDDIGFSFDNLIFTNPRDAANFAITVVITSITLGQLCRAAILLRKPILPEGEPTLAYDLGTLFPILRISYLIIYLLWNALSAVFIAAFYSLNAQVFVQPGFTPVTWFFSQLSSVLWLAMLLAILAYRARIQLNPEQKLFNMKSFLDGWLLSVILILGIAGDAVYGSEIPLPFYEYNPWTVANIGLAQNVLFAIGCFYVAGTAIFTHVQLKNAGIEDQIIRIAALYITPFVLLTGIFQLIDVGLTRSADELDTDAFNLMIDKLYIAETVIYGFDAVVVAGLTLLMGVPPKYLKSSAGRKEK